jgi:hypothetical protein
LPGYRRDRNQHQQEDNTRPSQKLSLISGSVITESDHGPVLFANRAVDPAIILASKRE